MFNKLSRANGIVDSIVTTNDFMADTETVVNIFYLLHFGVLKGVVGQGKQSRITLSAKVMPLKVGGF